MSIKVRLDKLEKRRGNNPINNMTREEKVARLNELIEISKERGCPDCQDCINPEVCKRIKEIEAEIL